MPTRARRRSRVGVSYLDLYQDVSAGDTLLLDDGLISLNVDAIEGTTIRTTVLIGGALSDRKGINRRAAAFRWRRWPRRTSTTFALAAKLDADFLAVSFVKWAADINRAAACCVRPAAMRRWSRRSSAPKRSSRWARSSRRATR